MKASCPECGFRHEVNLSHKNAYMCCLACDSFFKVKDKVDILSRVENFEEFIEHGIDRDTETAESSGKLRISSRKFKAAINRNWRAVLDKLSFSKAGKTADSDIAEARKSASIEDFLNAETDFTDLPEDEPREYIDFLTVGLDIESPDILEIHEKHNRPEKEKDRNTKDAQLP